MKDLEKNQNEAGATMVEYALVVSLIAVVCIAAISVIGRQASTSFSKIGSHISSANN